MFERTFKVKFITFKNCFCYLSDKYSKVLDQGTACKITFEDKTYYFSLGDYLITLKENEIGINATYANILGLEEYAFITFTECNNLPGISSLDISPCFKDDLEILELMAKNIQETLLNQIRVVNNSQKVIAWISNSVNVIVDVDGIKPAAPGRLQYLTEVVIKAPIPKENKEIMPNKLSIWNINTFLTSTKLSSITGDNILKKYDKSSMSLVFRVYSLEQLRKSVNKNINFDAYVPRNMLPISATENEVNNFFTLYPVYLPTESGFFDDDIVNRKNIVVRLCTLEQFEYEIETSHFIPIFMSAAILEYYKLINGSKIMLDPNVNIGTVSKIEILSESYNLDEVKYHFKSIVSENSTKNGMLLNSGIVIKIPNNSKILLKFTPDNVATCLINSDFIRNGKISVSKLEILGKQEVDISNKKLNDVCLDCGNFKYILDACMACLELGLMIYKNLEHILIVGKNGEGKSTLANSFVERVSKEPYYIHVETINCKNIKGKSIDSLHKLFTNVFLKLIYYQPSLLIIDDIDVICEKVVDDLATQESLLFNKVSEMLADLLQYYSENNFIICLATTQSTLKLNQQLFASRGKHLFKNIFTIKELNKNDRKVFLNYVFSKHNTCDDLDIDFLSLKTEGFVVQDLVDFAEKCVFESYKQESQIIKADHCLNVLSVCSSLSLKNVKLHSPGDRDFSDIGGLDDVKRILVESMMWPVQYTNIFGNSPLRLQSGLLLYGPPGTGKTMLAGAAAKQCGLRLISIKGPELLSKYIGASEQAVRDIFQKAQSAKPCILFFDEFDSLAPRRGHDNTGVTDRVVNQFLTQLDGIETLNGVCVLAATSRPDLLDPALLRPGRLDKQILCPLPTKEARLSILKALSKTLQFADNINLERIARVTAGYSGADLQSVLYTAQLTSVERLLNETETGEIVSKSRIEIDQRRLEEAVKTTRPSLTKEERLKYERIYAKFQGKVDISDIRTSKQKATLA